MKTFHFQNVTGSTGNITNQLIKFPVLQDAIKRTWIENFPYFYLQLGDWEAITVTLNLNLSQEWDECRQNDKQLISNMVQTRI